MKKIIFVLLTYTLITHPTPTMEDALNYQKNEKFVEAIACYEKIIEDNPLELNAYFNMGSCYLNIGNKEKAIAAFSHILEKQPSCYSCAL